MPYSTRIYRCEGADRVLHRNSKRLLALAAQKFISSISSDAFQYARTRTLAGPLPVAGAAGKNKDGTQTAGMSSSARAKVSLHRRFDCILWPKAGGVGGRRT